MSATRFSETVPVILIRGAGIIGLSIAWALLRRGVTPRIFDPARTEKKASWAAAGMLSAQFEALIEPQFSSQLYGFATRSVEIWPDFASSLEDQTGLKLHYCTGPTLGLMPAGLLAAFEHDRTLPDIDTHPSEDLLNRLVPGLSPGHRVPTIFRQDGQVDNRAVLEALMQACKACFTDQDEALSADIIIDCLGWQAGGVRPVKGQMMSLEPRADHPKVPVRWGAAYIVPKPDRTLIGASVEPDVSDLNIEAGRLDEMLSIACEIAPGLSDDIVVQERWAGLRPMARLQRPVIGWKEKGRHYVATGHYRNGILLAPATAERVVADILNLQCDGPDDLAELRP